MREVLEDILLILQSHSLFFIELQFVDHFNGTDLTRDFVGGFAHLTECSSSQHFMMDVIVVGEVGDGLVLDYEVTLASHKVGLVRNLCILLICTDRYKSLFCVLNFLS